MFCTPFIQRGFALPVSSARKGGYRVVDPCPTLAAPFRTRVMRGAGRGSRSAPVTHSTRPKWTFDARR
ncbi:hypothetical protein NDU88_002349 [Pleurodeles waltl]|uniref:Uncharacterized protein n=1 Tax=Pleurodeles waltl TaxID=8319 RepID=A0AAV7M269_PLEWA|nr:hypothetical protein NDU88_002349 [Pleurodeles waltl]